MTEESRANLNLISLLMGQTEKHMCVYAKIDPSLIAVLIFGSCPFLEDNECLEYNNRFEGCKKLILGSKRCNQARKNQSLEAI
jgi:hypothetical protein